MLKKNEAEDKPFHYLLIIFVILIAVWYESLLDFLRKFTSKVFEKLRKIRGLCT